MKSNEPTGSPPSDAILRKWKAKVFDYCAPTELFLSFSQNILLSQTEEGLAWHCRMPKTILHIHFFRLRFKTLQQSFWSLSEAVSATQWIFTRLSSRVYLALTSQQPQKLFVIKKILCFAADRLNNQQVYDNRLTLFQ